MKINFCLKNQNKKEVCLDDFKGKWVVLYFYPKDDTPGCTLEGIDFTKKLKEFEKLNAKIFGISGDSEESHCSFIKKHKLKIELLCDTDKKIAKKFEAYGEKTSFGKKIFGIIRSTFIINPKGEIVHSWKDVKVDGHVGEVLNKLKELQ